MAYQYMRVRSDGTLQRIALTFGIPQAAGVAIKVIEPSNSQSLTYTWDRTTSSVTFEKPVPKGYLLQITRETKTDLLYKFTKGALWTAAHIDADLEQCLAVAEEARTIASAGIYGDLNMQGYRIYGLPDATALDSPITYNQFIKLEAVANVWKQKTEDLQGELLSTAAEISTITVDNTSIKSLLGTLRSRVEALEARPIGGGSGGRLPDGFLDAKGNIASKYLGNALTYVTIRSSSGTDTFNKDAPPVTVYGPVGGVANSKPAIVFGDVGYEMILNGYRLPVPPNDNWITALGNTWRYGSIPTLATEKYTDDKVKELSDSLSTADTELSNRVSSLENGTSGALTAAWLADKSKEKPWLGMDDAGDYIAFEKRITRVEDPLKRTDAVNLRFLENHTDKVASVLIKQTDTKLKSLAQDTSERLQSVEKAVEALQGSGGVVTPTPTPNTPVAPSGGSVGVSCGLFFHNGQAKTYTSGSGVRVSTGTSREGRTFLFTVPAGMWEIRSSDNTSPGKISVGYSGAGAEGIQRTWGNYTVYTVVGMTSCTITVPASADTRSTQYVFTAIRIG